MTLRALGTGSGPPSPPPCSRESTHCPLQHRGVLKVRASEKESLPLPPEAPIATLSPRLKRTFCGTCCSCASSSPAAPSLATDLPFRFLCDCSACPYPMIVWWTSVSKTSKKHSLHTGWSVLGRRRIARRGCSTGHREQGAIVWWSCVVRERQRSRSRDGEFANFPSFFDRVRTTLCRCH